MRRKRIKAIDVECPLCGAKPGEGCRFRDGRESAIAHAKRVEMAARLRYVDARAEQSGQL